MNYGRGEELLYNENNGIILQPTQVGGDDTNEKTRLQQQPVKLQPSWEENDLSEDELNFRQLTMDAAALRLNIPRDKYNLVYITFLIHGIGVLIPWNMFITATDYFQKYKFSKDYIGYEFPYLPNFLQYLTFASQVPNVVFNWMNIFVQIGGNLTLRIVWSITIIIFVFIVTVAFAMVDTNNFAAEFFWITLVCVIILNMANGIYQNTIFGMAAKLPSKYTGAVILGSNICGTFTAVVSLLSGMLSSNQRTAAIYYFITAIFVLLICFDIYFALPLNRFYRHFELKDRKASEQIKERNRGIKERIPYMDIFIQALPQLYNVFMVFFVTLSVFPSIHASVKRSDDNFFVSDKFYTNVTCFLTFNIFAMLGSLLPSFLIWPGPKFLWIPVTIRLLYIPFYLMCNYQTEQKRILPVLITNDWVYWIVSVTLGLSSGYFSSLAMMYTPGMVKEERHQATAGMYAGASLISGIFGGILVSFIWPWFITHVGF